MGKLEQRALICGRKGLLTDALNRVFAKEGWRVHQTTGQAKRVREMLRLHGADVLLCWLGSHIERAGIASVTQAIDNVFSEAERQGTKTAFLLCAPDSKDSADAMALVGEQALVWDHQTNLHVTVVMMPPLYGPALQPEDTPLGRAVFRAIHEDKPVDAVAGIWTQGSALHEDDAAYGILQAVSRGYEDAYLVLSAENEDLPHTIGWRPRYAWPDGLRALWPQFVARSQALTEAQKKSERKRALRQVCRNVVPYLENVAGAGLMAGVAILQGGPLVNPQIYFDMNFLYIGTMGIVYGMRQAVIAMVLASILLIDLWLGMGRDIVGLLYEPVNLLHLTSYLFVAFLTGYFSDRRRQERLAAQWQKDLDHEQYAELSGFYEEALQAKDRLYRQIVNAEDSIGRLYHIIEPLDSVDVENVYDQAAQVTAKVLRVENIAIYIPDQAGEYLRSKVHRGPMTGDLPRSLKLDAVSWLRAIWRDKRLFVNRDLMPDAPDLAAPVIHEGHIIAVVTVYGMRFEQWSLAQENLLQVTTRLIAASLGRAHLFADETEEKRYLRGTNILQADAFTQLLDGLKRRQKLQTGFSLALLHLAVDGATPEAISEKLTHVLHTGDFVGEYQGDICVLLTDADEKAAGIVSRRLEDAGLRVALQEKVQV